LGLLNCHFPICPTKYGEEEEVDWFCVEEEDDDDDEDEDDRSIPGQEVVFHR
jgi:hypothetical protein